MPDEYFSKPEIYGYSVTDGALYPITDIGAMTLSDDYDFNNAEAGCYRIDHDLSCSFEITGHMSRVGMAMLFFGARTKRAIRRAIRKMEKERRRKLKVS